MLISSELGPRQRIAALFISADNLTDTASPEYSWVSEFCAKCGGCIKKCPTQAITEYKTSKGSLKTKIINESCEGCTICMKACSFNHGDYDRIKTRFYGSK